MRGWMILYSVVEHWQDALLIGHQFNGDKD
jgi:hypothetical protein